MRSRPLVVSAFGVRLESDLVVEAAATKYGWGSRPYLQFRYLTPVPFCRKLIDTALLDGVEIEWLDAFHATCREQITLERLQTAAGAHAAGVDQATAIEDAAKAWAWLERETAPMQR